MPSRALLLRWPLALSLIVELCGVCRVGRAIEPCPEARPWAGLGATGANFVQPMPLSLTALAIATPFGFAPTGLDQRLRVVAQRDLPGRPDLEPVSVWTPYVLAGGLLVGYGLSAAADSCSGKRLLSPIIQAGILTYFTVGVLKFAAGRRWPNGGTDPRAADRLEYPEGAHDFRPFQRGFGAWPSGHTAVLVAGASAFRVANPNLGWAAWLGYPLALGVASGMWLGDHHYVSDIISGALLGEAIGGSAGKSFSHALGIPGQFACLPVGQTGFTVQWLGPW